MIRFSWDFVGRQQLSGPTPRGRSAIRRTPEKTAINDLKAINDSQNAMMIRSFSCDLTGHRKIFWSDAPWILSQSWLLSSPRPSPFRNLSTGSADAKSLQCLFPNYNLL
jgi:hypothetical protein